MNLKHATIVIKCSVKYVLTLGKLAETKIAPAASRKSNKLSLIRC